LEWLRGAAETLKGVVKHALHNLGKAFFSVAAIVRTQWLGIFAVFSMFLGAMLSLGYAGMFGIVRFARDGLNPTTELATHDGVIRVGFARSGTKSNSFRLNIRFRGDQKPSEDWVWGFSSFQTAARRGVEFPIWSVLLPTFYAPIVWWRKRRRLPNRGFPIEPSDADTRPS
jgi:hypothetical protein